MLQSINRVGSGSPIQLQKVSQERNGSRTKPRDILLAGVREKGEAEVISLSEPILKIARSSSGRNVVATRKRLPLRHGFFRRRAHQIPDNIQLMGIALASQYRFSDKHFTKDAAVQELDRAG